MLRKYWTTALLVVVVVVVATAFFTLGEKKIYAAEATIQFNPNPPKPLGRRVENIVDMGAGSYWNNQEYYETQYRVIASRRVAQATVNELGLQNDQYFLQDVPPGEQPLPIDPSKRATLEHAARVLQGRLSVRPVKDSRIAVVTLKGAEPQRVARILTTLVDIYIAQNLDTATESTTSASQWLHGQLDTLKGDLESSEMALHSYRKDKDILSVAFDDQSNILREKIRYLNSELTRVQALQQHVAARRAELEDKAVENPSQISSPELLADPMLTSLRQAYERSVQDRDALLGTDKGLNHPDVKAANAKVVRSHQAVMDQIGSIRAAVDGEMMVVARRAGGLQGILTRAKSQAHQLNLLEIEHNRLDRQKSNTEKLYGMVLERSKEADLARMLRVNNIRLLDAPLEPSVPVYPRVPLNMAAGIFAGLLLGIGAAFLRGLLDRTLKVPDDIKDELQMTFLGLLPNYERNAKGVMDPSLKRSRRKRGRPVPLSGKPELIVHDQPTSSIAEAARAIRTNLIFMAPDNPHKTLLVTSPGPREGKTTVACCIAVAMAQAGQRVLLLDCDLRRPRVHRIFDLSTDTGVTTALIEGVSDDAIHSTSVPRLFVMPCGPVPPNPAEIFHSEKFRKLLDAVTSKFDRVIIDSPPVVAVTDATILSTLVDGTVLIARAFATRKEFGRHAVRSIRDVGGNLAGCVLNAVDFSRSEYKYSYYYYRRYDYYGAQKEPASERAPQLPAASHDGDEDPPSASATA